MQTIPTACRPEASKGGVCRAAQNSGADPDQHFGKSGSKDKAAHDKRA